MIEIVQGDILAVEADVAVLSAHRAYRGGGLSGHFHREAGPEQGGRKAAGSARAGHSVVTSGYRLKLTSRSLLHRDI